MSQFDEKIVTFARIKGLDRSGEANEVLDEQYNFNRIRWAHLNIHNPMFCIFCVPFAFIMYATKLNMLKTIGPVCGDRCYLCAKENLLCT